MGQMRGDILDTHDITESRGFLPGSDPLAAFNTPSHDEAVASYLDELDDIGQQLPNLLESRSFRPVAEELTPPPRELFDTLSQREIERLCLLSSFFASGYIHEIGSPSVQRLPAGVAVPLYRTSMYLGRKPIAAYDTICLRNFTMRDPDVGFEVDNIKPVQRFTNLSDETWFVAIHVSIEAAAGQALTACARAQRAIVAHDRDTVHDALETIAESLETQTASMRRMTEGNEPEAFVNGFRPYYQGFDGVSFEGVPELDGEPQTLRGGSGAQSSALPSIDAALGIEHEATELIDKLDDMRSYMPKVHREAIMAFGEGPDIADFVEAQDDVELVEAYNRCVDGIGAFREVHFQQVAQYIRKLSDDVKGTGGTDYMTFLPKMKRETEHQRLDHP